jgi:hypothetical protein
MRWASPRPLRHLFAHCKALLQHACIARHPAPLACRHRLAFPKLKYQYENDIFETKKGGQSGVDTSLVARRSYSCSPDLVLAAWLHLIRVGKFLKYQDTKGD